VNISAYVQDRAEVLDFMHMEAAPLIIEELPLGESNSLLGKG
jgi:hypothetical protein